MKQIIKIEEDESCKLKRLFYLFDSYQSLLARIMNNNYFTNKEFYNRFMKEYTDAYEEYCEFKNELTKKYSPENAISWEADFMNSSLNFEVSEC